MLVYCSCLRLYFLSSQQWRWTGSIWPAAYNWTLHKRSGVMCSWHTTNLQDKEKHRGTPPAQTSSFFLEINEAPQQLILSRRNNYHNLLLLSSLMPRNFSEALFCVEKETNARRSSLQSTQLWRLMIRAVQDYRRWDANKPWSLNKSQLKQNISSWQKNVETNICIGIHLKNNTVTQLMARMTINTTVRKDQCNSKLPQLKTELKTKWCHCLIEDETKAYSKLIFCKLLPSHHQPVLAQNFSQALRRNHPEVSAKWKCVSELGILIRSCTALPYLCCCNTRLLTHCIILCLSLTMFCVSLNILDLLEICLCACFPIAGYSRYCILWCYVSV